jgi:hypothetical protein
MFITTKSRAAGADISELFGYTPDDRSPKALKAKKSCACPFVGGTCSKTNHDQSVIYGVCSVSYGVKSSDRDIIICPKRLYVNNYACLRDVAEQVWGVSAVRGFVIGGSYESLRAQAAKHDTSIVAFGQGSGSEVGFTSGGSLSVDWVLQRYQKAPSGKLVAKDFICVEIQSIDTTGNYRNTREAYMEMTVASKCYPVPNSQHGLNWANVHKRLVPQLIRKGNVMLHAPRCLGMFFVLPDEVFQKFEEILPGLEKQNNHPKVGGLTVLTYALGEVPANGGIRSLERRRTVHYNLQDIALAFIAPSGPELGAAVDRQVERLL